MYRVVLTHRGEAWLTEGSRFPLHQALTVLRSPSLEASHPRSLFDAFCIRLNEHMNEAQSIDECRVLWRALGDNGLIAMRAILDTDAGCAFAADSSGMGGDRSRRLGMWERDPLASYGPERRPASQSSPTPAPALQEISLRARQAAGMVRTKLIHLVDAGSEL